MLTRLIGIAIAFGLIGFSVGFGADMGLFIHIPSAIIVIGLLGGGLLMSYGPRQILSAIDRSLSSRKGDLSPETLALHLAVFVRAHQLAWSAGLMGSIIGIVSMLQYLFDPSCLGSGIAVSLISMFYGVILAEFIINPLKHSLIARYHESFAKLPVEHGKTSKITPGFVIAFWIILFVSTIIAFGTFMGYPTFGPAPTVDFYPL